MKTKIGHPVPQLPVKDVEITQAYYKEKLGFDIAWTYPDKTIGAVSRPGVAIFFSKDTDPITPNIHWMFAEDVDATYRELKGSGANIVDDIENKPWGIRQFTIEDLNGHLFIIHHDL